MYIKVSIIVWKGVSDLQNGFFWAQFSSSREKRSYLNWKSSFHLEHRIFGALPVLCNAGLENIYPSVHFLNQSAKVLYKTSELKVWCPSRKFGHKMNLKGLLNVVLLDWRMKKISLLERFVNSFTFLAPLWF